MNLVLKARDLYWHLSKALVDELDAVLTRINTVWRVEHDPQTGRHRYATSQTTVGAAGAGAAVPATAAVYVQITYIDSNGDTQTGVIPVFAAE